MWHAILIALVALAIAGLVADLIVIITKAVIYLGMVISRQYSVSVDFSWNIIIAYILSLYIALFFLL